MCISICYKVNSCEKRKVCVCNSKLMVLGIVHVCVCPDPPILAFFDFLAFFCYPIFLAFLCVFPLFSKDFRGSAKRKTLAFLGKSPCFFQKARIGGSGCVLNS